MNSIGGAGAALEAYTPVLTSAVVNLGATGLTDLENVTETGYLASIGFAIPSTGGTCQIQITIDGQATHNIPISLAGVMQPAVTAYMSYAGATSILNVLLPFGYLRYVNTLRVSVSVISAGSGNLTIAMIRGKKI